MSRPDVSDERRPQIVEAAIQIFRRKGYRKTTMPDVARVAGLSVGGVYWYFKSKEEIVQAIMAQLFQTDLESLAILLNQSAPAAERLRAFIARYKESYDAMAWLTPVGIQFYAEAPHDAGVRAFIQQYLNHYRQALVALIEQGVASGEFWPVDAAAAANTFLALEEGLSLISAADPAGVQWQASFQLGAEMLVKGMERHA